MENIIISFKYLHFLFWKCNIVGSRYSYDVLAESTKLNQNFAGKIYLDDILNKLFIEVPPIYMYGETDNKKYYLLKRGWGIVKDFESVFVWGIKHKHFFQYLKTFIFDCKHAYSKERYAWYLNPNSK